ncbi:MAG: hypothetical protein RJA45_191, partial [Actinomycetota bacterium]
GALFLGLEERAELGRDAAMPQG